MKTLVEYDLRCYTDLMTVSKQTGLWSSGRITLITFLVLLIIVALIFGYMIFSYLLALLAGAMLALLAYPVLKKLTTIGVYPKIAGIFLTAGIMMLAVIPISFFVILAIKQSISIAEYLAGNEYFSSDSILNKISNFEFFDSFFNRPIDARKHIHEWVQEIGKATAVTIFGIAAFVPYIVLQLVLILVSFFYFLIDGPRFISWINDRIPLDPDVRSKIVSTFANTTISVIWATFAAATVQSAIMFVAFLVLWVPAIFLATAATFILAWIPIVGSTPVWLLGAIYLYSQGSFFKAVVMILFGIVTGISDNFVRPLVLKGRANMHPLISLVAIFGGIGIFGILGVFIGPLIAAVLISLLQIWPLIAERFGYRLKRSERTARH